jgi:hypothetical protein
MVFKYLRIKKIGANIAKTVPLDARKNPIAVAKIV